jgi:hypothetical protein
MDLPVQFSHIHPSRYFEHVCICLVEANRMKEHRLRVLVILTLCLLWLTACTPPPPTSPEDASQRAEATDLARTEVAELVEIAAAAANRQAYLPALPTSSFIPETPQPVVETPIPTQFPAGQPPAAPSDTPLPGSGQAGETITCYRAQFVTDVTISDNTPVLPGQPFTKTWRLVNNGACPWPPDTQLVYVDGAAMQGLSAPLGQTVEPGQPVDVSVQLTAPADPGTYRGLWMLANASGRFGLGQNGGEPFWVQVQVQAPAAQASGIVYKFAEHVCDASWRSAAAMLPCPGESSQPAGFVIPVGTPNLENRPEDELGLWTHPNQSEGGWIAGTFPPLIIQPGDHFIADVGCLADRPNCDVDFRLGYRPTSDETVLVQLGSWHESYDGSLQRIDLDLSGLAGQEIKLILAVAGFGPPDQNAAFWLVPQIRR